MEEINYIGEIPVDGEISEKLKKGAIGENVADLQGMLYQLGFGKELNWDKFKADGKYGDNCANALKAFAEKNGITTDGESLLEEVADLLINHMEFLEDLQVLDKDIAAKKVEEFYRLGSGHRSKIASLQELLFNLGYEKELNWDKFKNDGFYGKSTTDAVLAFSSSVGLESDGKILTEELASKIVEKLGAKLGSEWNSPTVVQQKMESGSSPLFVYEGSQFVGKSLKVHTGFRSALDRINGYAEKNNVQIFITSSFREDANVRGAVVPPARRSNHMVGHAFDFNLKYGAGYNSWANNAMMKKYPDVPAPVKGFIDDIKADVGLRWGGDFRPIDAIHIDDAFNQDRTAFDKRYKEIRE